MHEINNEITTPPLIRTMPFYSQTVGQFIVCVRSNYLPFICLEFFLKWCEVYSIRVIFKTWSETKGFVFKNWDIFHAIDWNACWELYVHIIFLGNSRLFSRLTSWFLVRLVHALLTFCSLLYFNFCILSVNIAYLETASLVKIAITTSD